MRERTGCTGRHGIPRGPTLHQRTAGQASGRSNAQLALPQEGKADPTFLPSPAVPSIQHASFEAGWKLMLEKERADCWLKATRTSSAAWEGLLAEWA